MIHQFAECDNCGQLEKVLGAVQAPKGWGELMQSFTPRSMDAAIDNRRWLLCPNCTRGAVASLAASKERTAAA